MNKKIALTIALPFLALFLAFGISSIISSKADNADMVVSDKTLVAYTGYETDVVIGSNVEVIGREAFAGNAFITSVTIPNTVKTIDVSAFNGCTSLKSIIIPDSVKVINDSAFTGCTSLSSVTLGSGLNKLGNGVFSDCDSLAYINTGSNENYVCSEGALYNRDKSVLYQYLAGYPGNVYRMPDSVKSAKQYAFWGADGLNEVTCSSSLDSIEEYVFAGCYGLQNVVINTPVRSIDIGAFLGDGMLLQIHLPVSVTSIADTAFERCPSDMVIVCEEGTYAYSYALNNEYLTAANPQILVTDNNMVYSPAVDVSGNVIPDAERTTSNGQTTLNELHPIDYSAPAQIEGELVSNTVIVADKAFIGLGDIEVIDGSSLSNGNYVIAQYSINPYAYYNNKDLQSYNFKNDDSIGLLAFARSGLTSVNIPEGVTEIGYGAFYHCDQLVNVSIPSTVTYIGQYAFVHTPWYENWLNDDSASDFLIVGDGVLIGYKGSDLEPDIPDTVKTIAEGVF